MDFETDTGTLQAGCFPASGARYSFAGTGAGSFAGSRPAFSAASPGALAARHLCRTTEVRLGFIGAGPAAERELFALAREFSIRAVRVWDEDRSRAESFREKFPGFSVAATNPKLVSDCDLLVTTTASRRPIVRARWIRKGTHINALGAVRPGMQELDDTLVACARVFVFDRKEAIRAGGVNMPASRGHFRPDMIAGTLGEVVAGNRGRMTAGEITVFDAAGSQPGTSPR